MSINILLEDQITKLFNDNPEYKSVTKNKFEVAVAHFVNLKYLNGLEFDDLIDGIMGNGGDEGIDLCYMFCNGYLVKDENVQINKDSSIKVKFFQVKKESSFSTDGFRKFKEGIEEVFNLDLELTNLKQIGANNEILEKTELIRNIFRKSRIERAKFSCEVYYITVCSNTDVSEKITHLSNELKSNTLSIPFEFHFFGAQKLIDLNQTFEELVEFKFDSQPLNISEKDVETIGFAGFINGNELMKSLINEDGTFKSHLTEGNVRFFLGEDQKINSSIIDTAKDLKKASNFWAMNNGLTIIGDSVVPLDSKIYSISNPQIVNGCQTIHCLHNVFSQENKNTLPETLKVFVKLIQTTNPDTQTDIISATNSQNQVKSASLKANDFIQKNIEKHLHSCGIFYERRDNFYKRQGLTGNKVIGLLKMAQIMHTVVNKESVIAFNDTTTIFDSEKKYNSIFNNKADYNLYKFGAIMYQRIWTIKNSDLRSNDHSSEERDLIGKGGFLFLNIISTLFLSDAEFIEKNEPIKKPITGKLQIDLPPRTNEFTKRSKWIFDNLENNEMLNTYYNISKKILWKAASNYANDTNKTKVSLYKYRAFDREYLKPIMDEYYKSEQSTAE